MKKLVYAAVAIFIVGILCFFIFPETKENAETTIATTEFTTTEITTTEPTTKEVITARVQVNARKKAATTTRKVENEITTTKAVTTKKVEPTTSHKNYSNYEVQLLAEIIYCEASGTSRDEMAKVGQVILNRRDTTYWEFANCKTIYDVVSQKGQYPETLAKINNGIKLSNSIDKAEMDKAMEVAEGLLSGTINSGLSKDVLWQTGFEPSWDVIVVCQTNWHYYSVLA